VHIAALADLHDPLMPILRHALALAPLPRAGAALDLACGPGLKTALLAAACGSGVRLVGIDRDVDAVRAVAAGIVGDALALPLRSGCCAAAFCLAALGLFGDRQAALRELHRALRPGAPALLLAGVQQWAQVIHWPPEIATCLATVYAAALADGVAPLPAGPDLGGELSELLGEAGFTSVLVRAFWLDQPGHGSPATDNPLESELPLLPWPALRALLAGRLTADELARCEQLAIGADVELCALALLALARA
jgi:SAM-dependent methyltransferase